MPGGSRRPYLEVADHGPGIPESLQDRVFVPFATGPNGGTGLGLFISRELCECNHAALLYEPRKGGGSIFRIVFADPARWGGSRVPKPLALVVDEEPDIRELLTLTLQRMDIDTRASGDIAGAKAQLRG